MHLRTYLDLFTLGKISLVQQPMSETNLKWHNYSRLKLSTLMGFNLSFALTDLKKFISA